MTHCKHQTGKARKHSAGSPADLGGCDSTLVNLRGHTETFACVCVSGAVSHTDTHSSLITLNNRDLVFNRSDTAVLERKVCAAVLIRPSIIIDAF